MSYVDKMADFATSPSDICCSICGRTLLCAETVAVIKTGMVFIDHVADVGDVEEVLCDSCDGAVTRYIQHIRRLRKDPTVIEDIDKLLDTIAEHVDIPYHDEQGGE